MCTRTCAREEDAYEKLYAKELCTLFVEYQLTILNLSQKPQKSAFVII